MLNRIDSGIVLTMLLTSMLAFTINIQQTDALHSTNTVATPKQRHHTVSFPRARDWWYEYVDSAADVGRHSSIALDSGDNPHISYYNAFDGDLKHAWWTGSEWSRETVDDHLDVDVGQHTSIAIDSSDYLHITYYDVTYDRLKYAYQDPFWNRVYLDATGTGKWSSIAIDSKDQPHISYYNETGGDLKYKWRDGYVWKTETVDSAADVGRHSSIALDSGDNPHISYYNATAGTLKYAKWTGSLWSIETVEAGGVGLYTSIAVDTNNNPHISHYDSTNGDLRYAKWVPNVWLRQAVDEYDDVGKFTSIAVDSNTDPHISYYDVTLGELKYAKWTASGFVTETVDTSPQVGKWTSIALDSSDLPHVSYFDDFGDSLKYAVWQTEELFVSIYTDKYTYYEGDTMSLGLDIANSGSAVTVCVAVWIEKPGGGIKVILHAHAVTLPTGLEYSNPSFRAFTLPSIPAGIYTWHAALLDPPTHEIIVEDTAEWQFT